jgi:ribokinase
MAVDAASPLRSDQLRGKRVIVVFGSINIDLVIATPTLPAPGETVLGGDYALLPGGKGANQALAARRAGASVTLAGAVGADVFAEPALALLRQAGVDLSLVRSVERPTGCASVVVARSGENLIAVASGANLLATADLVPDALLGPGTTLLLQLELTLAEVAGILARAHRQGARSILNLAPALPLEDEALRLVDVVVMNASEASTLGRAPETLAAELGITVVVTRGGEGAAAYLADGQRIAVPALPVEPVDTTGAGDAFTGVLAASLDAGKALGTSLRRASAAAGLACLGRGAQPSFPVAAAIESALARLPR